MGNKIQVTANNVKFVLGSGIEKALNQYKLSFVYIAVLVLLIHGRLSLLMQLLFSFDQDMRVEKTLLQTLPCQLSSTIKLYVCHLL